MKEENHVFVEKLRGFGINFETAENDLALFTKTAFEKRKTTWSTVYAILMVAAALGVFLTEQGHFFWMFLVPKITTWVR